MPKTVVVVPCYNEARRLASEEFLAFAARSGTEFLFVDDGSRDATSSVLENMAKRSPRRIGMLLLEANGGKGNAVRAGLRTALERGADVVAYLDADLSTPLEELGRLIAVRERTDADAVLGSRVGLLGHDIRRSLVRHYLGRLFATAASVVLRLQVYDTQCGAKVLRVGPALEQALSTPFRTRWVFDVEILARMRAADPALRFLEVPLRRWHAVGGSKLGPRDMVLAARDLLVLMRSE